ncbi:MAG: DNA/RNA nuclease SfsA [Clostridia bacterium]|nr:DNA/RNA nuclease SfsA [Clostridia bacterium]
MKYENIIKGIFIERPNRFIAICDIDGKKEICHVKNTGRCRELLIKGATVYLEKSSNPNRKTQYDLVTVQKNDRLINIDSQVVNKVAFDFLPTLFEGVKFIKPEYKYGNSRFDFYVETEYEKIFIEVKGVTLENDGVVRFPDAPTERGIKHLKELQKAVKEGYKAYVLFVIQMSDVKYFEPNSQTHPEFAEELRNARDNEVVPLAFDCAVTPDSIEIRKSVLIKI